jgi:uncharacterized protein
VTTAFAWLRSYENPYGALFVVSEGILCPLDSVKKVKIAGPRHNSSEYGNVFSHGLQTTGLQPTEIQKMNLTIYLPIAGNSVNFIMLLGLGGVVGFLAGLFGVGGGFLMTPMLITAGIPPLVAAASDSNQIVAASASGAFAHYRMGNVDFKMALFLLIGGGIGGTVGVQLIKILRSFGDAEFVIRILYVVLMGFVGSYTFFESLQNLRNRPHKSESVDPTRPSLYQRAFRALPFQTDFPKSGVSFSFLLPVSLGFLVGVLAAIMGIGGGFMMVPAMVYLLRMPMHVVVGTNLLQELFMCANVTVMQAATNRTVDIVVAIVLLLGSTIGAQLGARLSRRLKADQLKIILGAIILLVMVQMLLGLVIAPGGILAHRGGH